tara:strand:- start:760 stop:1011 length:252 start_codon:yes stop_codon:yes gene_type:complete
MKTKTQKQRLNEYQKFIDSNVTDENGRLKHWFVCQLDGFMEMTDLPIDEFDDEDWSNWENGDCDLVNQMVIESVFKMYLKNKN